MAFTCIFKNSLLHINFYYNNVYAKSLGGHKNINKQKKGLSYFEKKLMSFLMGFRIY